MRYRTITVLAVLEKTIGEARAVGQAVALDASERGEVGAQPEVGAIRIFGDDLEDRASDRRDQLDVRVLRELPRRKGGFQLSRAGAQLSVAVPEHGVVQQLPPIDADQGEPRE